MFCVTVTTDKTTIHRQYDRPVLAAQVLSDAGITQMKPCGGKGKCGKCVVLLDGGPVLSCSTYIRSDAHLHYTQKNSAIQGLVSNLTGVFSLDPLVEEGFGAAIDIGTTTIAGYIYRFPECTLVSSRCIPNPQGVFGADVVSRMEHSMAGKATELAQLVWDAINQLTEGYAVQKTVICGNTAMLHFLTEEDPSPMAFAPYVTKDLFGRWQKDCYLAPCASSFVGADVVAAVLAAGMEDTAVSLLIDIGTNGEMVLQTGQEMLCCSTAAGPCFEGAGLSCGVQAVSGAIDKVFIDDGVLNYTTIDGAPAVGICGSGLVDAIACLLELGIIDETGYMEDTYYFPDSSIYITGEDVRKFQLAKSAIRAGIETLLHTAKTTPEDIKSFYIAGGFGSFLRIESAVKTGLIPEVLAPIARSIGNAAGIGAGMMLLSKACFTKAQQLAGNMNTLTLTQNPFFADLYIEHMMFPEL